MKNYKLLIPFGLLALSVFNRCQSSAELKITEYTSEEFEQRMVDLAGKGKLQYDAASGNLHTNEAVMLNLLGKTEDEKSIIQYAISAGSLLDYLCGSEIMPLITSRVYENYSKILPSLENYRIRLGLDLRTRNLFRELDTRGLKALNTSLSTFNRIENQLKSLSVYYPGSEMIYKPGKEMDVINFKTNPFTFRYNLGIKGECNDESFIIHTVEKNSLAARYNLEIGDKIHLCGDLNFIDIPQAAFEENTVPTNQVVTSHFEELSKDNTSLVEVTTGLYICSAPAKKGAKLFMIYDAKDFAKRVLKEKFGSLLKQLFQDSTDEEKNITAYVSGLPMKDTDFCWNGYTLWGMVVEKLDGRFEFITPYIEENSNWKNIGSIEPKMKSTSKKESFIEWKELPDGNIYCKLKKLPMAVLIDREDSEFFPDFVKFITAVGISENSLSNKNLILDLRELSTEEKLNFNMYVQCIYIIKQLLPEKVQLKSEFALLYNKDFQEFFETAKQACSESDVILENKGEEIDVDSIYLSDKEVKKFYADFYTKMMDNIQKKLSTKAKKNLEYIHIWLKNVGFRGKFSNILQYLPRHKLDTFSSISVLVDYNVKGAGELIARTLSDNGATLFGSRTKGEVALFKTYQMLSVKDKHPKATKISLASVVWTRVIQMKSDNSCKPFDMKSHVEIDWIGPEAQILYWKQDNNEISGNPILLEIDPVLPTVTFKDEPISDDAYIDNWVKEVCLIKQEEFEKAELARGFPEESLNTELELAINSFDRIFYAINDKLTPVYPEFDLGIQYDTNSDTDTEEEDIVEQVERAFDKLAYRISTNKRNNYLVSKEVCNAD